MLLKNINRVSLQADWGLSHDAGMCDVCVCESFMSFMCAFRAIRLHANYCKHFENSQCTELQTNRFCTYSCGYAAQCRQVQIAKIYMRYK